ncbi:MAG: phosphate ABC transporter permease subunit PstC [Vicinamibacterales bacterium]|nr:phosphate ABC transporter permease subunit PstC [Vicinamibacterales bacterium]
MSRSTDRALLAGVGGAAAASGAIVMLMAVFLVVESLPVLSAVGVTRLLSDGAWFPVAGAIDGRFGLGPMIAGTLAVGAGALVVAAPLGLGSGLLCAFYAPAPIGVIYRRVLELMSGIPSVVYGWWGLVVLAPMIRQVQPPGQSLLTAMLILALMILPTIALLAEMALRQVPRSHVAGAAALGLSRWATIRGVVLPAARGGLVAALLLAFARAVGETMAVVMVAGNVVQVPDTVFAPVRTLTANIALELGYAMDTHRAALFASGLCLMGIAGVLVAVAARLPGRRGAGGRA